MKLLPSLVAALLITSSTMSYAVEEDVEIDFITGSDYAEMYQEIANNQAKFNDTFAKSSFANDELETDFISGSEYAAMDKEAKTNKSWFAFLSLK